MGDSAQVLVHPYCKADDAERFAVAVRDDLVRRRIIVQEISECGLAADGGHATGLEVASAIVPDAPEWAVPMPFSTNGVAFYATRSIFPVCEMDISLTCPACQQTFLAGDDYIDAACHWHAGDDNAAFVCPKCDGVQPVIDWDGPNPMGIGYFAIEFWKWGELRQEFIESIEKIIGHRLRRVYVHI